VERGAPANLTHLGMGAHTGNHGDAPVHFVRGGKGIDEMPLDAAIGRCRVVEMRDLESIEAEDLRLVDPRPYLSWIERRTERSEGTPRQGCGGILGLARKAEREPRWYVGA